MKEFNTANRPWSSFRVANDITEPAHTAMVYIEDTSHWGTPDDFTDCLAVN